VKDKKINKIKKLLELKNFLLKNTTKWSHIEEIKKTVDEFVNNTDEIIELKKICDKNISYFESDKEKKREELINIIVPVCNVLQVYAFDINNNDLNKQVNFPRHKLEKVKDSELSDIGNSIYKKSKKLYEKSIELVESKLIKNKKAKIQHVNIITYGITEEMIDELEKIYKAFVNSKSIFKKEKSSINKSEKKLNNLLKSNKKLLKNKLDKLMTLFELNDKNFFNQYLKARTLEAENISETSLSEGKTVSKTSTPKKTTTKAPAKSATQRKTKAKTTTKQNPVSENTPGTEGAKPGSSE